MIQVQSEEGASVIAEPSAGNRWMGVSPGPLVWRDEHEPRDAANLVGVGQG